MRELSKVGIDPARVEVTIVDARPSKPTFKQLGDEVGLDYGASRSIGGMKLSAVAYDAEGNETNTFEYSWYEHDIRMTGLSTWYDANKASNRFARNFAEELQGEPLENSNLEN